MNEMIERVAKALALAQCNSPYYVMPQFKNKYNVFKTNPPGHVDECMLSLVPQAEAEDECERLNNVYIVREIIKALAPASENLQNEYFKMALAEGNTHYKSCFPNAVWERAIDAIIKS